LPGSANGSTTGAGNYPGHYIICESTSSNAYGTAGRSDASAAAANNKVGSTGSDGLGIML